jgi:hypothetical protein
MPSLYTQKLEQFRLPSYMLQEIDLLTSKREQNLSAHNLPAPNLGTANLIT